MASQAPADRYDLRKRTKAFAVQVFRLCKKIPRDFESQYIRRQLARSVASVAANYRAACRARSRKEFIAKISIVVEECDESAFWMELGSDLGLHEDGAVQDAMKEANELIAIFVASRCTARRRLAEVKARQAEN